MSTKHDREQAGSTGEDPSLVRAWHKASDEQPPERLDAAILAAARRSLQAQDPVAPARPVPQRTRGRWMKWQPLAAAATVAGLAFVLVQTLPRQREIEPPIRIEVPAPAASPERDLAPPVQSEAAAAPPAPAVTLESRSNSPPSVVTEAPTELDPAQLSRERSDAGASREAAAPAATRTETFGSSTAAPPSAADRTTRIEALHASGDLAAAAAALREFRAADPDADSYLPESLRDWARTVR
jgi:hypothetical protein